jgi:hypothetical protein
MKPNYLCIGVQKGGTTSLIKYFNSHPEIYCREKEAHFFDKPQIKDCKDYNKLFSTNKKMVGEKTPSYCYLRYAIDKIHKYNPNMKLILILREPISRAYSQYNMELQNMKDLSKIDIYKEILREKNIKLSDIKKNGKYYVIRGFYDEQISYILSKFQKENLYIGIAEDIKNNINEEYNKIFKFLGVNSLEIKNNLDVHVRNYNNPIPKKLEKILYGIYKPHLEKLYKMIGRRIEKWDEYHKSI